MRALLLLCFLTISGCMTQDIQVVQLKYEVQALKEDVAAISKKLDQTNRTAVSANSKANSNTVKVTKAVSKADDAKAVAKQALDATALESPIPATEKKSVIMKPREINHETSLLPQ